MNQTKIFEIHIFGCELIAGSKAIKFIKDPVDIQSELQGVPKKITLLKFLLMIMVLIVVIKMMDDGGGAAAVDNDGDGDVGG